MGLLRRMAAALPPQRQMDYDDQLDPAWFGVDGSVPVAAGSWVGSANPPSSIPTVVAIVGTTSQTCGALPRLVMKDSPGDRSLVDDERYDYLRKRPNSLTAMSGNTFWEAVFASIDSWGQTFMFQDRFGPGWRGVQGLYFLMPQRVRPLMLSDEIRYQLRDDDEETRGRDEILQIMRHTYDGINGLSPIQAGAPAHELAELQETAARSFMRKGAQVGGVMTTQEQLNDQQVKEFYRDFDRFQAGAKNTGKVMLLQGNARYERIGIPPSDAQFLESRQFQREELVAYYAPGIPHHLLGWKSSASNWGTGVEAQTLAYVKFTLLPRLQRVEEVITQEFLEPGLKFEFAVDELLRGDSKTRAEVAWKERQAGILSADEWRYRERLGPRGIEDDYWQPLNVGRISAVSGELLDDEGQQELSNDFSESQQQLAAQEFYVDEMRCTNDECPSRRDGRKGALLATDLSGSATVVCRQCNGKTTIKPEYVVRDPIDLSEALDIELTRRLG